MKVLSSHGAIDQMIKLEEERSRLFSLVDELKKRLEVTNKLESTKTELTIERAQVKQRILIDHTDHEEVLREAILTFEELSREISNHEGSLEIDVSDNGPTFRIKVEGGHSVGIRNMQIFCFDMMLSIIWAKQSRGPGFLIHDSHLFDGMDSRQVAKAIEIGEAKSHEHEFQYIITMNSDQVPRHEFRTGFEFDRLTAVNTAFDDFPPSVAETHCHAFASLAAILLDTSKNRIQIEAEISQDEVLMLVLSDYETVIVEAVSPPFECRRGVPVPLDQHCVEVMALKRTVRRRPFAMPDILGVWTDPADGLPWYQASPVEFIPSAGESLPFPCLYLRSVL